MLTSVGSMLYHSVMLCSCTFFLLSCGSVAMLAIRSSLVGLMGRLYALYERIVSHNITMP
jgi:hypothetical protein